MKKNIQKIISADSLRNSSISAEILKYLRWILEKRNIAFTLAHSELQQTVATSRLSYLWWLLDPLLNLLCYVFLVSVLGRGKHFDIPYPIFILSALLPWSWTQGCLVGSTKIWGQYKSIIDQIRFPYILLIFSRYLHELALYVISFIIFFVACACYGIWPTLTWLLLPLVIAMHSLLIITLMLVCSILSFNMYDFEKILPYCLRIWFFLSPALYSIEMLPDRLRYIMKFNPMNVVFSTYRSILLYSRFPDWTSCGHFVVTLSLLLLTIFIVFVRKEPYINRYIRG